MEESDFTALLKKYRVVRPCTADLGRMVRPRKGPKASSGPGTAGGVVQRTQSDSTPALPTPAPQSDFWKGLKSFLESRCTPDDAKAIMQAFDKLHYGSLAALNYEDIEEATVMMAKESGLLSSSSSPQPA